MTYNKYKEYVNSHSKDNVWRCGDKDKDKDKDKYKDIKKIQVKNFF